MYSKKRIIKNGKTVWQYSLAERTLFRDLVLHMVVVDLDEEYSPVMVAPYSAIARAHKTRGGDYIIEGWPELGVISTDRLRDMRADYLLTKSQALCALQDGTLIYYPDRVAVINRFFGGVDPTKQAVMEEPRII